MLNNAQIEKVANSLFSKNAGNLNRRFSIVQKTHHFEQCYKAVEKTSEVKIVTEQCINKAGRYGKLPPDIPTENLEPRNIQKKAKKAHKA